MEGLLEADALLEERLTSLELTQSSADLATAAFKIELDVCAGRVDDVQVQISELLEQWEAHQNAQRAWALGLAYLRLSARSGPVVWLGGADAPPLEPMLSVLTADASVGAVLGEGGILARREALDAVSGEISAQALAAAGCRVVQSPRPRPQILEWIQRPFTRRDLAPVPHGWVTGPPDFIGVGCGKAGSSWWYELLSRHPDVVPNRLRAKELHFLCHFDYRGPSPEDIATYQAAFARPAGRLVAGPGFWKYSLVPIARPAGGPGRWKYSIFRLSGRWTARAAGNTVLSGRSAGGRSGLSVRFPSGAHTPNHHRSIS